MAAAEQIDERLDRQRVKRVLGCRRSDRVGPPAVLDDEVARDRHQYGRRANHVADIAEAVGILPDRDLGMEPQSNRA
jgi:hypothetical protein